MKKIKKYVSVGKAYARANYSQINGEKKNRNIAYFKLKQSLIYPELCNAFDFLTKNTHKTRTELLIGNPLPKSYSELGKLNERPIIGLYADKGLTPVELASEFNLVLIGIRQHKFEINLFLKYKEAYETYLLIGDYENADKQLTKIENEICYSLWSLENRFVLKELSGKASENKEFLSQFNESNDTEGITKYLAHYLSLRAEHSLSINRYFNDLEISLNNLKESDTKEAFQNYYRFKLTFLNHLDFNNYGEIIALDFQHSIIDRYLNITKILTNLLAVSSYLDEEKDKKIALKGYLQNRINYLLRKIDDPILYKLKLLSGETLFPAFDIKKSQDEIKIIDNYTSGLYDVVEKELQKLLLTNPTQFDLYVLYIKSLIYQKKSFNAVGNKKSVQNEILNDLFKIISVTTNPDQAALNLLRIANNITSCSLSYGITDFVYFQTQGKKERKLLSRLSYNIANPIIYDVFTEDLDKQNFLNMLSEKFPSSITVEFFSERLKGLDYLIKYEKKIPEGKFKVELARKYQEKNDFINASIEWEFLINNYKDTAPILETAIVNLFQCYLKLDQPNKCIDLFVDSFFYNNHIIDKIEFRELLDKIHSKKFRNVEKGINLPIFYTIVDAGEVETHLAYELFNLSLGIEKPSELLSKISEFDQKKFMYFLEFTCSPKVLMHSTFIENSKERLEERLSIANFIREKDTGNKNIVSEIKNIQNILVIQQGLIDLDESKIYVNEQGIIENELQDFQAIYERFEIISGITGNKKFLWLEGGKLTTYSSQENTEMEKIEYSNNPVFDIYMELFNAVKDKFLNSQFGIVAYLSTRIRHGVLVGELRPIFENHQLITLKEGNSSKYRRNNYWDFVYNNFTQSQKEQIQITLSDFASKIDGVIFDLIKKHLQVYRPEINDEGWFNYEFDETELWYHSIVAIKSENFQDFVQGIFGVLWHRTDENLELIRENIQNDILNQFNTYFDELERQIIQQLGEQNSEPIRKSIKDCSTEIQTVIQKISRWFKRSEIKAADFKLSELINIVAEYTSKSSWQKRLVLTREIHFDCNLKGTYKTHFADLIRIFLENIIKHSSENAFELKCKISAVLEEENNLKIIIENEITDKNSIEALRSIWNGNTPDTDKLLNEGKSGYHKAFKILTSDLRCSKNQCLKTSISEDENLFSVILSIDIKDLKQ
ncbi:Protein of unknown function [Flavobacterium indicum GPTSA100-9 = DSM 17447]|uniref:Uncharacterized protein n=1 Tax=Flavobacterium indicum (strain DSM 17447 / CIP 109464 / GPTSA100-9) TaxID=1094466 RepID=H8XP74_FLAIG|nr:hypothetical protein [Flavobacterium indicum]CCG53148.1 Protein of unknown function [Flavobacterium indicum GPTSA100-9 = DSM 17447]